MNRLARLLFLAVALCFLSCRAFSLVIPGPSRHFRPARPSSPAAPSRGGAFATWVARAGEEKISGLFPFLADHSSAQAPSRLSLLADKAGALGSRAAERGGELRERLVDEGGEVIFGVWEIFEDFVASEPPANAAQAVMRVVTMAWKVVASLLANVWLLLLAFATGMVLTALAAGAAVSVVWMVKRVVGGAVRLLRGGNIKRSSAGTWQQERLRRRVAVSPVRDAKAVDSRPPRNPTPEAGPSTITVTKGAYKGVARQSAMEWGMDKGRGSEGEYLVVAHARLGIVAELPLNGGGCVVRAGEGGEVVMLGADGRADEVERLMTLERVWKRAAMSGKRIASQAPSDIGTWGVEQMDDGSLKLECWLTGQVVMLGKEGLEHRGGGRAVEFGLEGDGVGVDGGGSGARQRLGSVPIREAPRRADAPASKPWQPPTPPESSPKAPRDVPQKGPRVSQAAAEAAPGGGGGQWRIVKGESGKDAGYFVVSHEALGLVAEFPIKGAGFLVRGGEGQPIRRLWADGKWYERFALQTGDRLVGAASAGEVVRGGLGMELGKWEIGKGGTELVCGETGEVVVLGEKGLVHRGDVREIEVGASGEWNESVLARPEEELTTERRDVGGGVEEEEEEVEMPDELICPIGKKPLVDPWVASDGYSYDKRAITAWLEDNDTSPVTGEVLATKKLVPNNTMRRIIQQIS